MGIFGCLVEKVKFCLTMQVYLSAVDLGNLEGNEEICEVASYHLHDSISSGLSNCRICEVFSHKESHYIALLVAQNKPSWCRVYKNSAVLYYCNDTLGHKYLLTYLWISRKSVERDKAHYFVITVHFDLLGGST